MSKFCKNSGGEIINNVCTKCEKKSLNYKDIIFIIIDILRYVLAIFFLILGIGSIPKLLGFIFILLSISLLPFIYSLILDYFGSYINVKLIFILSYIIPIFLFVVCIFLPLDSINNNVDKNYTSNDTNNLGIVDLIKENLDSYKSLISYNLIEGTNKYDFIVKYDKSSLTMYVCASDAISYVEKYLGNANINSIQFQCYNSDGLINYIKFENIFSGTKDNIINNTTYYDTNYNIIDTNINVLKANTENDYKNSCESYTYKDVLRNPEQYSGKNAYWFGKVVQVVEKTSYYSILRVNVNCEKLHYVNDYMCSDTIYVTYYGNQSFIDDDMVKLWGTMAGTETYTSVLGASVTIPKVYALYIDLQ